jgi:hypothetical protein
MDLRQLEYLLRVAQRNNEPRLEALMAQLMAANEASPEAFARLDLQPPSRHAGARSEARPPDDRE